MQLGNEEDGEVDHEEDDMLFYVRCNPRTTGEEASVNSTILKQFNILILNFGTFFFIYLCCKFSGSFSIQIENSFD